MKTKTQNKPTKNKKNATKQSVTAPKTKQPKHLRAMVELLHYSLTSAEILLVEI